MFRSTTFINIRRAIGVLFAAAAASVSHAGPINYANAQVGIRAGIVIVQANLQAGVAANDTPFVWYNLDSNKLVKPAGWNIYNPHSPSTVSFDAYTRWTSLSSSYGSSAPYAVGTTLTKQMASYWEVNLDTASDGTIADYDVLLIDTENMLSLNSSERTRLQRFMDHGGVLWVDSSAGAVDAGNGTPLAFTLAPGTQGPTSINPVSPLASTPYTLDSNIYWSYNSNNVFDLAQVNLGSAGYGNLIPVLNTVGADFSRFEVVGTSPTGAPTILSARVGDGAMVVTSRGAAQTLNRASVGGAFSYNNGFAANTPLFDSLSNSAAEFAVNAITLSSTFSQGSQGARKTNGTSIDIGAPLLAKWKDETRGGPLPSQQPIIYKGLIIVSSNNHLYAYSQNPGADLDFDGNPDDGYADYALGASRDLIWDSGALNGPISAPVAVALPGLNNGTDDQIFVVDGNGNLLAFKAFPLGSNNLLLASNPPLSTYSPPSTPEAITGDAPLAPTVQDDIVYVSDNVDNGFGSAQGRIWLVNPRDPTVTTGWQVGDAPQHAMNPISASATVGYVPISDNSGGADKIVYCPTAFSNTQNCGITSLWAGVKGEKHAIQGTITGASMNVQTRAGASGAPVYLPTNTSVSNPLGVRVTLQYKDGSPVDVGTTSTLLSGTIQNISGTLWLGLKAGVTQSSFDTAGGGRGISTVSLDYTIDWSATGVGQTQSIIRGAIQLPDGATARTKSIIGSLGLSPAGTLYAVEGDEFASTTNGTFWAFREEPRGRFKVVTRFDLYPSYSFTANGTTVNQSQTFDDLDQLNNVNGISAIAGGTTITDMTFVSGPAVANGFVYVKARGLKSSGFSIPSTMLLCFAAEPSLPSFPVGILASGFTIVQPDISRSTDANKTTPDVFTTLTQAQVNYTTNLTGGTITLDSLSSSSAGLLNQTLDESQPIIIKQAGLPDQVIEPSNIGNWSPLQWYSVFFGLNDGANPGGLTVNTGNPIVTGGTVFLAGNSYLPIILKGLSPVGNPPTGVLMGMKSIISPSSDPYAVNNATRPWFRQIMNVTSSGGNFTGANPDMLWPQYSNIGSLNEFRVRLYQTALGGSDTSVTRNAYGIAAGSGELVAYSDQGVYGFTRADFTVADEGRLGVFDPAGNAIWTSDQTISYGASIAGAAGSSAPGNSKPLVRPTRAYPISSNDYLVADPGSNRIVRMDKSGKEIRSIDSFTVDPTYIPDGYKASEPFTFNSPEDVLTYSDFTTSSPFQNAQATEYWRHYVIADSGNQRLVEIVDRYAVNTATRQPTTLIQAGVLYYHSPSTLTGKGYDYNGVARIRVGTGATASYVYAASTGTSMPTRTGLGLDNEVPTATSGTPQPIDSRAGNGGIVLINGQSSTVINQITVPQIAAGVIPTLGPNNVATGFTTYAFNTQPIPQHIKTLNNVSSVNLSNYLNDATGVSELRIMFTDSSGVYEVALDSTTNTWVVRWMLPEIIYKTLRRDTAGDIISGQNPAGLRATYARRTDAGTVIISNGFYGTTLDNVTDTAGEVLELLGDSAPVEDGFSFTAPFLGFDPTSIRYQLPSVHGARGIVAPVFADRR